MKKILISLTCLFFLSHCTKTEDTDWWLYGKEYHVSNMWANLYTSPEDVLPVYFSSPRNVTMTRMHPIGKRGDGILKVGSIEVNFKWDCVNAKKVHLKFSEHALSIQGIGVPGPFLAGFLDKDFEVIKEKRKQGTLFQAEVIIFRDEETGTEIVLTDKI